MVRDLVNFLSLSFDLVVVCRVATSRVMNPFFPLRMKRRRLFLVPAALFLRNLPFVLLRFLFTFTLSGA